MSKPTSLSLTSRQHQELLEALRPGSAATEALLVCGCREGNRRCRLMVKRICPVSSPHSEGTVATGNELAQALPKLDGTVLVARAASRRANQPYDAEDSPHTSRAPVGSVAITENGLMSGAVYHEDGGVEPLESINVVGDDLRFWYPRTGTGGVPEFAASHAQAFGKGTTEMLQRLSVAAVGCSGSGSPVIEQLARLGVRELVLVDDDIIEARNVNRVFNSTMVDAQARRLKVDVIADAVRRIGLGTEVIVVPRNMWTPEAVRQVAQCDVLFGCVDTIDARFLLNLLATHYTMPYFDIGIRLDALPAGPDQGRIREVCGSVHYLQPGRSSLMSRGLFGMDAVRSAGLRRTDPSAAAREADEGYISGVQESRPAVISVNTFAASLAVIDFLARLHPFRQEPNGNCAQIEFSLASTEFYKEEETGDCATISRYLGLGDTDPLLNLTELSCGVA